MDQNFAQLQSEIHRFSDVVYATTFTVDDVLKPLCIGVYTDLRSGLNLNGLTGSC